MMNYPTRLIFGALFVLLAGANITTGQILLADDTLFIGSATGQAGEHIAVPVSIKTSVAYQGWQVPIRFGGALSPLFIDSVSLVGSCMESTPHEWDFIAPFKNNGQWDQKHAAGVAGVVDLTPPYDMLPAGSYLVMNLCLTIDSNAAGQTIVLDTSTCAWYNGGPQNRYIVVVNGQSHVTVVMPGTVTITGQAVAETGQGTLRRFDVTPTVVRPGIPVRIRFSPARAGSVEPKLVDGAGRLVDRAAPVSSRDGSGDILIDTGGLSKGVYFVIGPDGCRHVCRKIIVE